MSRTTTALKRLGVPGLAAVTLVAGLPLFLGSAQAAHVGSLTLTPETASAAVGTCESFTVTLAPSAGAQLDATETVDVVLTERTASGSQTVTFCQVDGDNDATNNPQTPDEGAATGTRVGTAGTTTRAEFTSPRNEDGTVTVRFGVTATEPGTVDIRAFYEPDTADNNNFDGNELNDTSVLTVTQGNNPPANTNVSRLDAEPESQTVFSGETATITATVFNASGDPLAGVTPRAVFNSGPNSSRTVTCTPSDNDGESFCTFQPTTAGTDTITVFVDQGTVTAGVGSPGNGQLDGNEPQDTVTVTTAANPENLVVELTCDGPATDSSRNLCINPTSDTTETFTAVVTRADGTDAGTDRDRVAGVVVRFTEDAANGSVQPVEETTDANGVARTTLTRIGNSQQDIVVTATIRGQDVNNDAPVTDTSGQRTSDTATKRFSDVNAATDARNINLTPESATTVSGDARTFTATATDRFGRPVEGVTVTFTEDGPGRFVSGSSTATDVTDAAGQATAEVIAFRDETGTQTITATITSPRNAGTADDECEQAASTTGGAQPAGNCSDTATNTFVLTTASPSASPSETASPSPSPSNTASPSPSSSQTPGGPANCDVTPTIDVLDATIIATGAARIRVNAPANSQIEVLGYSNPDRTYRVVRRATIDADGNAANFLLVPPTNTRIFAQIVGCDTDEVRFSKVINVRTQLSLNVERLGTQTYRFFGDSLPARRGGLIVSLYRVTDSGRQVLTAQTRAVALGQPNAGEYSITRRFTGTGRFGFVVRTGQDLLNAPGSSNVRSLLIF